MPWATLLAGCLAGTTLLAILAHFADTSNSPLDQNQVRITVLPAIAALAFVPHAPFRSVTQATPLPAWLAAAGQAVLAIPVLALTCWVQLHLMTDTMPADAGSHPPAIYPFIAQFTGWCALTVAAAACCDRSRYADLGGAIAAPISLAAIALAWYTPGIRSLLDVPPATPSGATISWSVTAAAALALTCAASRDSWRRYGRYALIATRFQA